MSDEIKLHLGGTKAKEGWKILNILPGPDVDILGTCTDLSMFEDNTVSVVYASHVLEHISSADVIKSLNEISRILKPAGLLKGSVPNLDILFPMFLERASNPADQIKILHMVYGGHVDEFDVHHFGFNPGILAGLLAGTGFSRLDIVEQLYEFQDTSTYKYDGIAISLNFIATK